MKTIRLPRVLGAGLFLLGLCLRAVTCGAVAEPPRPLRYVTFNLFHGGTLSGRSGSASELERRLEIAAEELRGLEVDLIGLQEASMGRQRGNVAARLAAYLGFHYVYTPANPRLFNSDGFSGAIASLLGFTEGPAIVSRFPIVASDAFELPRCGKLVESRRLLSATLDTPWGRVRAFSAHTMGEPCQTRQVAEFVRERRGPLSSVLMGDFNALEDSPAIAEFTRHAGFIDAFRTANPSQPGWTVWQRIDQPASTVRRRVDYVFLVPGGTAGGTVLSSRLVLNSPRSLPDGKIIWPSDHYGVLAKLAVFPAQAEKAGARVAGMVPGPPGSLVRPR